MYDILKLSAVAFLLCIVAVACFGKPRRKRVDMVLTLKQNFLIIKANKIMELTIQVGTFVVGTLGLVDHNTQQPVEATFSNPQNFSDDDDVATVDSNNKVVAVGAGETVVTLQTDVDYVDANTGLPVHTVKTVEVNVTVTVAPTPQETDLVVTFSPAQPV